MSKPLAKSLHTVTVLVQVARHIRDNGPVPLISREAAMQEALIVLELSDKPDTYNLTQAAIKQLYK